MGDSGNNATNGGTAAGGNDDDRKLFVGGLAQEVKEGDLKEYFGKFGAVAQANIKMDQMTGRSRGFAFVVFEEVSSLDPVLAEKEHVIKGKSVAVKKAASKQGKIYVGKFNTPITEDQIRAHFEQFGNVVEIQRPVDRSKNSEPKNFCFVTFDKEEPANQLLKKATANVCGQEVEIKKVTVKPDGGAGGGMRGGGGGMRGMMSGGRGGYWGGGGQGGFGGQGGGGGGGWGGYGGQGGGGGGWGYDAPPGPWSGYSYGGGGGGGWGGGNVGVGGQGGGQGWGGDGGYGGGGKMGGGTGGNFRGRGRGGRSAPY